MLPKVKYQPTPEQIALSEERKRNKQKAPKKAVALIDQEKGGVIPREWITLRDVVEKPAVTQRVKIMTWNLLAQCLVRRTMFPTSDCLKAPQREHMLYCELESHKADILCLQEVDRLDKLLPVLESLGYSHVYAAGPRKLHGCLIAYKKDTYQKTDERVILYDEQDVRDTGDERARRGSSFRTKNIASIVALRRSESDDMGVVVATTHLFWHPRYAYERARQAGILRREMLKFQKDIGHSNWPCIIAGDFNCQPDDAVYSLLVGDPVLSSQEQPLALSRVVHLTIDPSVPVTTTKAPAGEEEGTAEPPANEEDETGTDPDQVIANARPATSSDGLLSTAELTELYSVHGGTHLKSLYDEGQKLLRTTSDPHTRTYGDRATPSEIVSSNRRGMYEPEWTSYTHYWKSTLDYIFILDPPHETSTVTGFLRPLRTEDLVPGLPRKGVSGSDHVSLVAEAAWSNSPVPSS